MLERSVPPSFGGMTPNLRFGSMNRVGGRTRYGVPGATWWSVLEFLSGSARQVNYFLVSCASGLRGETVSMNWVGGRTQYGVPSGT